MPPDKWDRRILAQHLGFATMLLLASGAFYAADRWILHGSWVESAVGIAAMNAICIFLYTAPVFI